VSSCRGVLVVVVDNRSIWPQPPLVDVWACPGWTKDDTGENLLSIRVLGLTVLSYLS
jgi:hypothetical protein